MNEVSKKKIEYKITQDLIEKNKANINIKLLQETFFVIPVNDGEAKRACQILEALEAPYLRKSKQRWGATLDQEWHASDWLIPKGIKRILVFEMPAEKPKNSLVSLEEEIINMGYELVIIDHHHYWWVDRYQKLSSLEQLCHFINWPINFTDLAIATNDRSYIPGLKKLGLSNEEILEVRKYDLIAQGYTEKKITELINKAPDLTKTLRKCGSLWILDKLDFDRSFIIQELALMTASGLANVFEIRTKGLRFSGSPKVVNRLLTLDFCNFGFKKGYICYGGGDETLSKYWGFRPKYAHEKIKENFVKEIIKQIGMEIEIA